MVIEKIMCPVCKRNYLEIELNEGYEVDLSKRLSEHTHSVYCDNCKRKIRYSIKKKEKVKI